MKGARGLSTLSTQLLVIGVMLAVAGGLALAGGTKEEAATSATTLVVWDTFSTEQNSPLLERFVSDFEKGNPNIKVERRVTATGDMRKTIKLSLGSETGPDIFYYDAGPAFGEVLVKAGLVEDLDEVYKEKGWDKRVGQGPRDMVTLKGKTYGIPNEVEFHAMWHNVDMFKKMGFKTPQTWAEFTEICQKLANQDIVSWPWGDRKGIWYSWIQAPFFEAVAGGSTVLKALEGQVPWNAPEFVEAVELEKQFFQKKYFNQDFASLDSPEVRMMFYNEQAGMMPRGTWEKSRLATARADGTISFDYDHFRLPPYKKGVDATSPGGIGSAWYISAVSKNKKAAAAFLDLTISDEAALGWLKAGYVPALKLSDSIIAQAGLDPVMTKIIKWAAEMHTGATNTILPGSVNEYLFHNAPRAWRGEITAKEVQDNFQKLYQEHLK